MPTIILLSSVQK
uniref:Uncharacterized protein n=1 Tax=Rhizophora mucronata TaxID=61149 RepID=A0A2P2QF66_RHIMU